MVAQDVDLDGDLDVISSLADGDDVRYYENFGSGFFAAPQSLATVWPNNPDGAAMALAMDVDGDVDIDIVSASFFDSKIMWYEKQSMIATTYCTSNGNSTGLVTSLAVSGTHIASFNQIALTAANMPASTFGFFLASRTPDVVNMPAGSRGVLCLGGAIGRYVGPGQIKFSGADLRIRLVLDLTRTPTPTGLVSAVPGQTWHFQAWHRDNVMGSTSNFSDAVRVTLQ